jgi:hypothetical protein
VRAFSETTSMLRSTMVYSLAQPEMAADATVVARIRLTVHFVGLFMVVPSG